MSLIEQYRELHDEGKFQGFSLLQHTSRISDLVKKHGSQTILDYGSGKGKQYRPPHNLDKIWGVEVTLYDPAVKGIDKLPEGKFDGVICSDVLEHIPEEEIDKTILQLESYARQFVFVSICTRPAKKLLPDGRNCHITVRPEEWWLERIPGDWEVAWNV